MTVIDTYLRNIPTLEREILECVRDAVHELVPDAQEVISYGMPGFKYEGKYVCGFNAFKDHLSFFPTSEPIAQLRDQLADYKIATGTIQFNAEQPLPVPLIKALVQVRLDAIKKNQT